MGEWSSSTASTLCEHLLDSLHGRISWRLGVVFPVGWSYPKVDPNCGRTRVRRYMSTHVLGQIIAKRSVVQSPKWPVGRIPHRGPTCNHEQCPPRARIIAYLTVPYSDIVAA